MTPEIADRLPVLSFDYVAAAKRSRGPLAALSAAEIEELAMRYRKFLYLKAKNPHLAVSPTEIIDEMWHLHMLHPRAYHEDCVRTFGFILDHKPGFGADEETRPRLLGTFARTAALWEEEFSEPYAIPGKPLQGVIICADETDDKPVKKPKPPAKPGEKPAPPKQTALAHA